MYRVFWFFSGLLAGILLVVLSTILLLTFLVDYIVVTNNPQKSDAIVVLGGDPDGSRLKTGLRLYEQNFAQKVLLIGTQKKEWVAIRNRYCQSCDIETDYMVILEGSVDTRTDAKIALNYCRANNYHRVIVVTSPYHTRRAQLVFNDIFEKSRIDVVVVPSKLHEKPDHWWRNRLILETVWLEFGKILYWELTPFMEFQGDEGPAK